MAQIVIFYFPCIYLNCREGASELEWSQELVTPSGSHCCLRHHLLFSSTDIFQECGIGSRPMKQTQVFQAGIPASQIVSQLLCQIPVSHRTIAFTIYPKDKLLSSCHAIVRKNRAPGHLTEHHIGPLFSCTPVDQAECRPWEGRQIPSTE